MLAEAEMSHRILVVEDNLLNRELLCDWLQTEGYIALAAASLKEAFDAFVQSPPTRSCWMYNSGRRTDSLLAEWIRTDSQFRSLPVIAVTAHAMVTDHQRVMRAGCNACVSKPIDFALLKNHLNAFLSAVP